MKKHRLTDDDITKPLTAQERRVASKLAAMFRRDARECMGYKLRDHAIKSSWAARQMEALAAGGTPLHVFVFLILGE